MGDEIGEITDKKIIFFPVTLSSHTISFPFPFFFVFCSRPNDTTWEENIGRAHAACEAVGDAANDVAGNVSFES